MKRAQCRRHYLVLESRARQLFKAGAAVAEKGQAEEYDPKVNFSGQGMPCGMLEL